MTAKPHESKPGVGNPPPKPREEKVLLVASNRRAFHDFFVAAEYEAGLALTGTEVKSLRDGHCQLQAAYAKVEDDADEVWAYAVNIPEYRNAGPLFQHAPQRKRKLLLHRREIVKLRKGLREKGTTLIPLKVYFKKGRAKMLIGLCRGKKAWDKRSAKKDRDVKRDLARYKS